MRQSAGALDAETLMRFFAKGHAKFDDVDFQAELKACHEAKGDPSKLIDKAQNAIFEELGVNGAWGMEQLKVVRQQHRNNADLIQAFFAFVEREELALDEAELSTDEFLNRLTERQKIAEQREVAMRMMQGLTPEQQGLIMNSLQQLGMLLTQRMQMMTDQEERMDFAREQQRWQASIVDLPPAERLKAVQDRAQETMRVEAQRAPDASGQRMER